MSFDSNSFKPITLGASIVSSSLGRFIPEPKSSSGLSFGSVLSSLGSAAGGALSSAAGANDFSGLIQEQIEVQKTMMVVSMESNLLKSDHETRMAVVRNAKVG